MKLYGIAKNESTIELLIGKSKQRIGIYTAFQACVAELNRW